jgi:hypothetical protein
VRLLGCGRGTARLHRLADSAFEIACNSYGRICVALDVAVHHASAAPLDEPVTAEAVEVPRSSRVASYRITATGADYCSRVAPGHGGPHFPLARRRRPLVAGLARRPLTARVSPIATPARSA